MFRLPGDLRRLAVPLKSATIMLKRHERGLADAVQQQELVMQEIHHRVKNNLQIVASLLNLQASRIRLPKPGRSSSRPGTGSARSQPCTATCMPTESCTPLICATSWWSFAASC